MQQLIGVARVSTATQAEDGKEGLGRQHMSIKRIAKAQGAALTKIVDIVDVQGQSVASAPQWVNEVLPALKQGAYLAVDDIDRIARVTGFDFTVLQQITDLSGKLYDPSGEINLADGTQGLIAVIRAKVAGEDKKRLKAKMWGGKESRREKGEWTQAVHLLPHGITYMKEAVAGERWGYDVEAEAVKAAFHTYADGGSHNDAAKLMGVSRTGARLILRNSVYKGVLSYDTRKIDGVYVRRAPEDVLRVRVFGQGCQHPQLVTDDVWDAVQSRLTAKTDSFRKARQKSAPTSWATSYLSSALAPVEGAPKTGRFSPDMDKETTKHVLYTRTLGRKPNRDRREPRYVCRCCNDKKMTPCKVGYHTTDKVNATLDVYLTGLSSEGTLHDAVKAQNKRVGGTVSKSLLEARLAKLEKAQERANDLYVGVDGAWPPIEGASLDRG